MKNGIEIKELALEYCPEIVEIHRAIMKGNISDTWRKSIELHLQKKDVVGYVALKDGKVVGFIIGEVKGPSFGLEKSGWIIGLEAHPQFMGTGIGRVLMDSIFKYFREKGVRDIFTAIRWDAVDMLSFFIATGFDRSEFVNLGKQLDNVKTE
ncbi:GNAT family N-acetyltransferase [Syntrophus aciditrophicus]|jgi:GNAT superfamily N-acetyltransferase|uniref:Acetyltransferase (GNAT) family protein n=1 Tax=Syntrophus aciditrophicus (strain SB) TaxID=56780 RepID=Q2LXS4_SYNAS|nr:GNAT family N-acetyltransferase [Syntrophus aciditrophicus]ABC78884.1 acetyltransferase (GNAT) family protein [Syntrophus aciditrophicus SB]OPY19286.1 MAG: putative acetyltransferase [Syntrophus sp. PtaB.Bin075]